jgi:hypothetical protein
MCRVRRGCGLSIAADPSRGWFYGGRPDRYPGALHRRAAWPVARPARHRQNRPGVVSTLAANDMMSRPRDGYDLLACTYLDSVNTLLYKKLRYTLADLLGITLFADLKFILAEERTFLRKVVA